MKTTHRILLLVLLIFTAGSLTLTGTDSRLDLPWTGDAWLEGAWLKNVGIEQAWAGGNEDEDDPWSPSNPVAVRAVWQQDKARPGDQVALAVIADIEHGYHINANQAQLGDNGDFEPHPTSLVITARHEDLLVESPRYPEPHAIRVGYIDGDLQSFDGETVFYVPLKVDLDATAASLEITVEFEYQACDSVVCYMPQKVQITRSLALAAKGEAVNTQYPGIFAGLATASAAVGATAGGVAFDLFGLSFSIDAASRVGLVLLLLTAVLGGLLLNFTPCVLPVIPIKIMSLSNVAGSRGRVFVLGGIMSLGVIAFWLGLGVLITTVAGFTATNQLFQYPAFTIGVGLVIAFMAIAMTGLFNIQLPNAIYAINPSQESLHGSFGFGIMTAVLSTPCTAPFMGAAAAWAATQSAAVTMATFGAIGIGMALPYLVLAVFPGLVRKMPRTGPGSELIKQVMGLFMLAAAAYFVGVGLSALTAKAPDPPDKTYWWVVMALLAASGGWLAWQTLRIAKSPVRKVFFTLVGLLFIVGAVQGGRALTDKGPIAWVYYTPERFETALAQGNVVVMDFTAEWCLNCKSLEHGVLNDDEVTRELARPGVVPMKVDITGRNPAGKAMLTETGRLTIPLLVVYAPNGSEVFKSDFYTVDQVVEAIGEAEGKDLSQSR